MINNYNFVKLGTRRKNTNFNFSGANTLQHLLSISVIFCWYWPKYLFVLSMCKLTFLYWVCWLYSPILQRHKIPFLVPLWRSLWENKTHRIKVTRMIIWRLSQSHFIQIQSWSKRIEQQHFTTVTVSPFFGYKHWSTTQSVCYQSET